MCKKEETLWLITMPYILWISSLSPQKRELPYIQVLTQSLIYRTLSQVLRFEQSSL